MPKPYNYEVQGVPPFPLDMLRYDECWPVSSGSVDGLTENGKSMVTVRLRSNKLPTGERWHTFGWAVGKVERR